MTKFSDSREKAGSAPTKGFPFDIIKFLQIDPKEIDHLTDEQRKFFFKIRDIAGEATAKAKTENYDLIGRYIPLWFHKAQELKRVADIVLDTIKDDCEYIQDGRSYFQTVNWSDRESHGADEDLELELGYLESTNLNSTYLLLIGFALENILKGYCVLRHPDLIYGSNFDKRLATHDLKKIAQKLHLKLSEDEAELLQKLSRIVKWDGRYPIPLEPEEYGRCAKEDVMTSALSTCYRDAFALGDAPTVFDELYDRLHLPLFVEWAKKVTSGGYDQRTQDFIRDVWSANTD
jgi:hypothetical protein